MYKICFSFDKAASEFFSESNFLVSRAISVPVQGMQESAFVKTFSKAFEFQGTSLRDDIDNPQ